MASDVTKGAWSVTQIKLSSLAGPGTRIADDMPGSVSFCFLRASNGMLSSLFFLSDPLL
jgi:hypothetical protein